MAETFLQPEGVNFLFSSEKKKLHVEKPKIIEESKEEAGSKIKLLINSYF